MPGGSVLVGSQRPSARPLPRFGLIPVMTGPPPEAVQPSYKPFGCGTQRRDIAAVTGDWTALWAPSSGDRNSRVGREGFQTLITQFCSEALWRQGFHSWIPWPRISGYSLEPLPQGALLGLPASPLTCLLCFSLSPVLLGPARLMWLGREVPGTSVSPHHLADPQGTVHLSPVKVSICLGATVI